MSKQQRPDLYELIEDLRYIARLCKNLDMEMKEAQRKLRSLPNKKYIAEQDYFYQFARQELMRAPILTDGAITDITEIMKDEKQNKQA